MLSSLAQAISRHPVEELRKMLDTARAAAQRTQFEVEVIEEALDSAPQSRPKNPAAVAPSARPSPQEARERVLGIIGELGPVAPKAVKEVIGDESINVYNTLSQLVKEGRLMRDDSIYSLPKTYANGQHPSGAPTAAQQTSSHPMYAPEGGG